MEFEEKQGKKLLMPELRIELACNATVSESTVSIKSASEAIVLIEGVQKLIADHMILIYLDENNAVMGIDAFLHNIKDLMHGEANRALSRTITHFSGAGRVDQVIIVQALPGIINPDITSINTEMLATVVVKMMVFDIHVKDCILMGTASHFSYKETNGAWDTLQRAIQPKLDFFGIQ